jgi:hypothetical protein
MLKASCDARRIFATADPNWADKIDNNTMTGGGTALTVLTRLEEGKTARLETWESRMNDFEGQR